MCKEIKTTKSSTSDKWKSHIRKKGKKNQFQNVIENKREGILAVRDP